MERMFCIYLCITALQFSAAARDLPFTKTRKENSGRTLRGSELRSKRVPKYLIKLFHRRGKTLTGKVNVIRGVFPSKTSRTKRSFRIVFKQEYLTHTELWQKEELRMFMNKPKGYISRLTKRQYLLKVFDLYTKKLVSVHKLPKDKIGWHTIPITGWRNLGPGRIRSRWVGLKLAVFLGKNRVRMDHTPFRFTKLRREPYLVVYSQEKSRGTVANLKTQRVFHDGETLSLLERFNRKVVEE